MSVAAQELDRLRRVAASEGPRPDYLADARMAKVQLDTLSSYVRQTGAFTPEEVADCATKFKLVTLAEEKRVDLEPLLATIPMDAPVFSRTYGRTRTPQKAAAPPSVRGPTAPPSERAEGAATYTQWERDGGGRQHMHVAAAVTGLSQWERDEAKRHAELAKRAAARATELDAAARASLAVTRAAERAELLREEEFECEQLKATEFALKSSKLAATMAATAKAAAKAKAAEDAELAEDAARIEQMNESRRARVRRPAGNAGPLDETSGTPGGQAVGKLSLNHMDHFETPGSLLVNPTRDDDDEYLGHITAAAESRLANQLATLNRFGTPAAAQAEKPEPDRYGMPPSWQAPVDVSSDAIDAEPMLRNGNVKALLSADKLVARKQDEERALAEAEVEAFEAKKAIRQREHAEAMVRAEAEADKRLKAAEELEKQAALAALEAANVAATRAMEDAQKATAAAESAAQMAGAMQATLATEIAKHLKEAAEAAERGEVHAQRAGEKAASDLQMFARQLWTDAEAQHAAAKANEAAVAAAAAANLAQLVQTSKLASEADQVVVAVA